MYRTLADLVVIVHFGFVLFAVLGALLALRWPRVVWVHVPAAVWAAFIEFAGWVCPLTPLEKWLRMRSGGAGYSGGFVDHYVLPILYPEGLTRDTQIILGFLVILLNLAIYGWLLRRRWSRRKSREAGRV